MAGIIPCPTKTFHTTTYPAISPLKPSLSAAGKTIVITGGGTGLGASFADSFAQAGATKIAILGRTEKTLLETKKTVEKTYKGTEVLTFVADVVDEGRIAKVAAEIRERLGKWDVLISNAGFSPDLKPVKDADVKDWWRGYEVCSLTILPHHTTPTNNPPQVNVLGTLIVAKSFIPTASPNATLINVNSAAAHFPGVPNMSSYGTSKTASSKLFECLHHEHPELRVFNVHPGIILTPMHQKNLDNGLKVPVPEDDGESCLVFPPLQLCAHASRSPLLKAPRGLTLF